MLDRAHNRGAGGDATRPFNHIRTLFAQMSTTHVVGNHNATFYPLPPTIGSAPPGDTFTNMPPPRWNTTH